MCTIESNRAGEKLAGSLTSEEEVMGRWGGVRADKAVFSVQFSVVQVGEVNRQGVYQLWRDLWGVYHRNLFWGRELRGLIQRNGSL